ncbi:MAG: hypothetical protein M1834_005768 [Cirrosporium novae-zelandiae]|nr:MAG: hypothetical protein M1834_005768 [Cirrosporium novae-zelandiae]
MSASQNTPQLTDKDGKFFLAVLGNLEAPLKIDWGEVVKATGMKNISTAQTRYGQLKTRYGVKRPGTNSRPTNVTKVTKPRASPRKARAPAAQKTTEASEDTEGEDVDEAIMADSNMDVTKAPNPVLTPDLETEKDGKTEDKAEETGATKIKTEEN